MSAVQLTPSSHVGATPATQAPVATLQVSVPLQNRRSLQARSSAQATRGGRQALTASQPRPPGQFTGPPQAPAVHTSGPVQALASLQAEPLGTAAWRQAPSGAQVSAVQGFESSQSSAMSQGVQPTMGVASQSLFTQVSTVQAFSSLQFAATVQTAP